MKLKKLFKQLQELESEGISISTYPMEGVYVLTEDSLTINTDNNKEDLAFEQNETYGFEIEGYEVSEDGYILIHGADNCGGQSDTLILESKGRIL